jgi:hypothetical protein
MFLSLSDDYASGKHVAHSNSLLTVNLFLKDMPHVSRISEMRQSQLSNNMQIWIICDI